MRLPSALSTLLRARVQHPLRSLYATLDEHMLERSDVPPAHTSSIDAGSVTPTRLRSRAQEAGDARSGTYNRTA